MRHLYKACFVVIDPISKERYKVLSRPIFDQLSDFLKYVEAIVYGLITHVVDEYGNEIDLKHVRSIHRVSYFKQ